MFSLKENFRDGKGKNFSKILAADGGLVFEGCFQLPHRPLLVPRPDHIDRTRKGVKEDGDEKDDHRFHDDHNHGEDDEDEEAEGFSPSQVELFKAGVPNVGNHEKG